MACVVQREGCPRGIPGRLDDIAVKIALRPQRALALLLRRELLPSRAACATGHVEELAPREGHYVLGTWRLYRGATTPAMTTRIEIRRCMLRLLTGSVEQSRRKPRRRVPAGQPARSGLIQTERRVNVNGSLGARSRRRGFCAGRDLRHRRVTGRAAARGAFKDGSAETRNGPARCNSISWAVRSIRSRPSAAPRGGPAAGARGRSIGLAAGAPGGLDVSRLPADRAPGVKGGAAGAGAEHLAGALHEPVS